MHKRTTMYKLLLSVFSVIILLSCSDDERDIKLDVLYNISEEQFAKHEVFRTLISDADTLGDNGTSLDSFSVEMIHCNINEVCDSVYIGFGINVLLGDTILFKNDRLSFINTADYIELGLDHYGDTFNYLVFRKYEGDKLTGPAYIYGDIDSLDQNDGFIQLNIPAYDPRITLSLKGSN